MRRSSLWNSIHPAIEINSSDNECEQASDSSTDQGKDDTLERIGSNMRKLERLEICVRFHYLYFSWTISIYCYYLPSSMDSHSTNCILLLKIIFHQRILISFFVNNIFILITSLSVRHSICLPIDFTNPMNVIKVYL